MFCLIKYNGKLKKFIWSNWLCIPSLLIIQIKIVTGWLKRKKLIEWTLSSKLSAMLGFTTVKNEDEFNEIVLLFLDKNTKLKSWNCVNNIFWNCPKSPMNFFQLINETLQVSHSFVTKAMFYILSVPALCWLHWVKDFVRIDKLVLVDLI